MAVDTPLGGAALRQLGDRARPLNLAGERVLPVIPVLAGVLPGGGLQRGTTVATVGPGSVSLALALVAGPSAAGSWSAVVGIPSLGLLAAAELGVALERLVLVDRPAPGMWSTVVAALLDAFEVVVVRPEQRVRVADQRRLLARARERGAVVVQAGGRSDAWPDAPDVRMAVTAQGWRGLEVGHGHLRARRVTVEVTGRRATGRRREVDLWLPGRAGRPGPVPTSEPGWRQAPRVAGTQPGSSGPPGLLREAG